MKMYVCMCMSVVCTRFHIFHIIWQIAAVVVLKMVCGSYNHLLLSISPYKFFFSFSKFSNAYIISLWPYFVLLTACLSVHVDAALSKNIINLLSLYIYGHQKPTINAISHSTNDHNVVQNFTHISIPHYV